MQCLLQKLPGELLFKGIDSGRQKTVELKEATFLTSKCGSCNEFRVRCLRSIYLCWIEGWREGLCPEMRLKSKRFYLKSNLLGSSLVKKHWNRRFGREVSMESVAIERKSALSMRRSAADNWSVGPSDDGPSHGVCRTINTHWSTFNLESESGWIAQLKLLPLQVWLSATLDSTVA